MTRGWKMLAVGTALVLSVYIVLSAIAVVRVQHQRAEVCFKFSGQIRKTIRRGDKQIDKLHIPGYGPEQKADAHHENRKTLAAFSDRACNSTSSLLP
jgi:hypothetical protein